MPGNRPAVAGEGLSPSVTARLVVAAAPVLRTAAAAQPVQLPAQIRPGQRPAGRRRATSLLRLVSPVLLIAVWQLVSDAGLVSAQKLPPPTQIWSTAVSLVTTDSPAYGTLQGAMLVSLERVAIGFAFGAAIACCWPSWPGSAGSARHAVDPLMQMLRTLPLFGLIPVFIVWFGIGEGAQDHPDRHRRRGPALPERVRRHPQRRPQARRARPGPAPEPARAAHADRPAGRHAADPGGLRQSLGVAWLALVVAEQINANAGLGFMISQATQFLRNDVIIVCLLVYCILGLLTDWLVRVLERRALAWRRSFVAA